jgi:hypothetical protein
MESVSVYCVWLGDSLSNRTCFAHHKLMVARALGYWSVVDDVIKIDTTVLEKAYMNVELDNPTCTQYREV